MSEVARVAPTHPISVLRDQIAPGASDAELAYFAAVCARLDLSPFADQIILVGRYDKRVKREVFRHQLTVAGRRTLATRTGRPYRVAGPVWCGPRESRTGGELRWREVWDRDEPPYCARCRIYFPEFAGPVANGTAKWDEFAQRDSNGNLIPTWASMPSHMLGKVSESMALRRAFPDVIDAAVADEFPFGGDAAAGDDLAELAEASGQAIGDSSVVLPASETPPPALPTDYEVSEDWEPSLRDQSEAHRVIGAMRGVERSEFLAQWDIGDFGDAWPAAAVADALGLIREE